MYMKMAVFWAVAPCSMVEITDISEVLAASIIRAVALMMEAAAVRTSNLTSCT
jgi:alkylhydroperoxidase family enzyme